MAEAKVKIVMTDEQEFEALAVCCKEIERTESLEQRERILSYLWDRCLISPLKKQTAIPYKGD